MPVAQQRLTASSDINRIVQGEELSLTVELFDEISKQVLNVADATAVVASFAGVLVDDEPTTVTASLLDDDIQLLEDGRIRIDLSDEKTDALKTGDAQSWQIAITLADGSTRIVQLLESLEVVASLF